MPERSPIPEGISTRRHGNDEIRRLMENAAAEKKATARSATKGESPTPKVQPRSQGSGLGHQPGVGRQDAGPTRKKTQSAAPQTPENKQVPRGAEPAGTDWEKRARRNKKIAIAAFSTLSVLVVGGLLVGNANNIVNGVNNFNHGQASAGSANIHLDNIKKLGTDSLDPKYCQEDDTIAGVITFDGDLTLQPTLSGPVAPYMTEDTWKSLPEKTDKQREDKATFKNFITEDGFPHAKYVDLSLAFSFCDPTGGAVDEEIDGPLTIRRNNIDVHIKNLGTVDPVQQINDDENVTLDLSKGQNVTYPRDNFFFGPNGDPVHDKALTDLTAAMQTETQQQLIMEIGKAEFVKALTAVPSDIDNVTYSGVGDIKNIRDAFDTALTQQLRGETPQQNKAVVTGRYNVMVDTQNDPNTKQSIVLPNAATGASPLIGLIPGEFTATDVKVKLGTPPPKEISAASPTQ